MLSAEIIFDYVWQHFLSLYPEARHLTVDYRENYGGKVLVPARGLSFFEKKLPFPEQLHWCQWDGQRVPFLFSEEEQDLLKEEQGKIRVTSDIIGAAFYFLSGWQEVHSQVRDKFNRFPYRESLQHKHSFVTVPVVNYYFDILKTALEKGYGISLKNSRANSLTTFLSHDVDRLESAWKVLGLKQLKQGNLPAIPKLGWQKLRGRDYWHNLKSVAETVKKPGGTSTFFWLAENRKYQGHPNADYDITKPRYQQLIRCLQEEGFENGIHGSFGSSENAEQLQQEMVKLQTEVTGNRFHYLCFDPVKTPQVLTQAGLKYDSTLGFAEHFGFRHGYCYPFRLFDFSALKPYPFLEIPLNLMDTTLWHPQYLQVAPEQLAATVRPMLQEIKKFGGVFTVLWHNENFSELNRQNGLTAFNKLLQELQETGTTFRNGRHLWQEFAGRLQ